MIDCGGLVLFRGVDINEYRYERSGKRLAELISTLHTDVPVLNTGNTLNLTQKNYFFQIDQVMRAT
ncbi:hypothetical protein PM8797T_21808 [Gimesia maris DSM 8797]|nr:hypothetical protein PM8797T_21808 [Gimesia maris DSM 8797]